MRKALKLFDFKILLFSMVFGLAASFGLSVKDTDTLCFKAIPFLLAAAAMYLLLTAAVRLVKRAEAEDTAARKAYGIKVWWILFISLILVCIPAYSVYYPGTSYYDTMIIVQNGMMMASQYPVLYCLLIVLLTKIGMFFGSLKISAVLYCAAQILVISALSARICYWTLNRAVPRVIKWFTLLWFFINPFLQMYAIAIIKEPVFSAAIAALCTIVYDMLSSEKPSKRQWLFFGACVLLLVIFRSNGIYVAIPLLLILAIRLKKARKPLAAVFCGIVVLLAASKALYLRFDVEPYFKESLAIPLQQMSAVAAKGGSINEEEAEFLNTLLPLETIAENYDSTNADSIKWNVHFNDEYLNKHKFEFIKTWFSMLPRNLGIYIEAYLKQTLWYWSPWRQGNTLVFTRIGGVSKDWLAENGLASDPLIGGTLYTALKSYYGLAVYALHEGALTWIMAVCFLLTCICKKGSRSLLAFLPCILCWLTVMISSPTNGSIRYMLPLAYTVPVFLTLVFTKGEQAQASNALTK